jgi:copper ion binding protein
MLRAELQTPESTTGRAHEALSSLWEHHDDSETARETPTITKEYRPMATSSYAVVGMTCGHCVDAVRDEVGDVDGVRRVDVELASGTVTVESEHPVDPAAVIAAVAEAGYEVAPT